MSSAEYFKPAEQYDLYNLIGCPHNVIKYLNHILIDKNIKQKILNIQSIY